MINIFVGLNQSVFIKKVLKSAPNCEDNLPFRAFHIVRHKMSAVQQLTIGIIFSLLIAIETVIK